ncbi:MAG: MFS transporter [Cyanobacteriota bacterium]|jgi:BCD family chlorophyll transporter-like MFS transporter
MSLVSPILPRRTRLLLACLSPAVSLMVLGGPFTQIGIAQLGLPATVVAALVALHPLTAICRPWFGRLSDRFPFWGYRRSGYLRAGLFGSWAVFPLPLLGLLALGHHWPGASAEQRLLALVGEGLLVVLLGLANQLVHTMISTLLLEITPLPQRGGALVELWLVQSCGLVALAGITGLLLRQWQTWPLAHQLLGVWLCWGSLLVPLALWSVAGLESRHGSRHAGVAPLLAPPLENPPRRAAFWAPAGFVDIALFCFLLVLQSALFVQEVLLDPYATERFGWTLSRTTFLGAIWAVGSVGGLLVGERWPRLRRGGCPGTALGYGLLVAGSLGFQALPLPLPVLLLGCSAGLVHGWIAHQIGRRCRGDHLGEQAGVWGATVVLSRSLGLLLAGLLFDLPSRLLGFAHGPSYGFAFSVAALLPLIGMLLAAPVARYTPRGLSGFPAPECGEQALER